MTTPSLAALLMVAFASPASSATPTRDQYVEQVEPICEAGTVANRNVLRGVEKMVREGETKRPAARFARAAEALEGVVKRLAAVPRPPADASRLSRWLAHAKTGNALLRRMGSTLKKGRRSKVQDMANELLRETKQGNAVVVGFDFDSCRLNPARFV